MEKKQNKNVVWTSLPEDLLKKFDEQCEKEKRTRPQLLRIILEEYYTKSKKGDKQ
jgi:metal-responsive CopG/Arc/MetJ family transcriptional regulator